MAGDEYEPNRVLGIPWTRNPHTRRDRESQHVMGFPVDWFADINIDTDRIRPLAHPIRGYQRWLRRRRLGPYAIDEDEPRQKR